MADRRDILVILLNSYLESLSGTDPQGRLEPLEGVPIRVRREGESLDIDLMLGGEAFRLGYPATASGLAEATRDLKDLAHLSQNNILRLGESLRLDPERGYYWSDPQGGDRRYVGVFEYDDDEEGLNHGPQ